MSDNKFFLIKAIYSEIICKVNVDFWEKLKANYITTKKAFNIDFKTRKMFANLLRNREKIFPKIRNHNFFFLFFFGLF